MRTLAAVLMWAAVPAAATVQQEISDYMQRLQDHPQEVMGEMPARRRGAHRATSPFTPEQVKSGEYVSLKAQQREKLLRASSVSRQAQAASASQEQAAALVDGGASVITNLWRLDAEVPREYTLPTQSWSDTYWPLYRGSTGWRYGDKGLAATRPRKWSDFYEYSQEHPVATYNTTEKASDLSPSEKYDLIVGDADGYLTQHAWNSGKGYADRNNGSVETWMGLCHGWAPAAYMLPRPVRTISVTGANGEEVVMYPADVKALGTMLWANVEFTNRFIGGRCDKKEADLETDEATGRVKDQECFDTNPGTLHIAVTNQLGVSHRSLIIDATFDYEVWNQPVHSYQLAYFNVKTFRWEATPQEATIPLADHTEDRLAAYRSERSTHIVGVRMVMEYLVETEPTQAEEDSEESDYVMTVHYYYDLELDEAGEIVGGEWYNNRHPDFLWTPAPDTEPRPYYAWQLSGEWAEGEAVPSSWRWASAEASRYGHLQTKIVNELFRRSAIPLPLPEYPRGCGRVPQAAPLDADGTGFLEHPGANQTYVNYDVQCWHLGACPAGQSLVLTWDMFDTEDTYDFVSVYTTPEEGNRWTRVFHESGSRSFGALRVTGPVVVRFTSDYTVTATGFAASYECATVAGTDTDTV
eukprot:TRINITY_DN48_c0_g1_i2.p1 TRINITY_DN48_c0_g1~~TRINITY_DN48_c0_g1_i2.p1  ORF type:complete len:639 (+),score=237.93 TRINITY_DN48_c0_g1_i2:67-1983(+)